MCRLKIPPVETVMCLHIQNSPWKFDKSRFKNEGVFNFITIVFYHLSIKPTHQFMIFWENEAGKLSKNFNHFAFLFPLNKIQFIRLNLANILDSRCILKWSAFSLLFDHSIFPSPYKSIPV